MNCTVILKHRDTFKHNKRNVKSEMPLTPITPYTYYTVDRIFTLVGHSKQDTGHSRQDGYIRTVHGYLH